MVIVRQSSYHRLKENNNRKKRALQERERQVENLEQEKQELLKLTGGGSSSASDSKLADAEKEIENLKAFNEATTNQMMAKIKELQQEKDEAVRKLDEKSKNFQDHLQSLEKNSGNSSQFNGKAQLIEASEQIDTLRNTVQMLESQLLTSAQSRQVLEKNLQQETMRRDAMSSQMNEEIASLQAALQESRGGEPGGAVAAVDASASKELKERNEQLYGNLQTAMQELKLSNAKVQEMRSDNEQLANAVSNYHEKYRRLLAKVQGQAEDAPKVEEEKSPAVDALSQHLAEEHKEESKENEAPKEESKEQVKEVIVPVDKKDIEEAAAPEAEPEPKAPAPQAEPEDVNNIDNVAPPAPAVDDSGLADLMSVVKDVAKA